LPWQQRIRAAEWFGKCFLTEELGNLGHPQSLDWWADILQTIGNTDSLLLEQTRRCNAIAMVKF